MFPISICGCIQVPEIRPSDMDHFLGRLEGELTKERAGNLKREGGRVSFLGHGVAGYLLPWHVWDILNFIEKGDIEVAGGRPGTIRYRFTCVGSLIVITLLVVVGLAKEALAGLWPVPLIAWAWLFGMNYLLASFRLRGLVRRATKA